MKKSLTMSGAGIIMLATLVITIGTQVPKSEESTESEVGKLVLERTKEDMKSFNLPNELYLENVEKSSQERLEEATTIRETERDRVHEEKLEAERKEKERLRLLKEEKEREEAKKKQFVVISRGNNDSNVQQRAQEYRQQQQEQIAQQSQSSGGTNLGTFQVTGYGADCVGCSGITAAGIDVRGGITHYQGYRVIATDPNVIPMFSIVNIEGVGNCIAVDTGGAIKGNIIDLLFPSEAHTHAWGRQHRNVSIIRYGG